MSKKPTTKNIRLDNVMFSYVHVYEPKLNEQSGILQYSVQVCVPKDNKQAIEIMENARKQAISDGIACGLFANEKIVTDSNFRDFWKDGDAYYEIDPKESREHLKGHLFFNATNKEAFPPKTLNEYGQVTSDPSVIYSGCIGSVLIGIRPYSNAGKGISKYLKAIMKTEDGDRLGGSGDYTEEFSSLAKPMSFSGGSEDDVPF